MLNTPKNCNIFLEPKKRRNMKMCNLTIEIQKEETNTKHIAEKIGATRDNDGQICSQPLVKTNTS